MLRRSEEHAVEQGMARMEVLHKRYKQAQQEGNTTLAKKLRRDYCQEAFINVCIAASPMDTSHGQRLSFSERLKVECE